MWRTNRYPRHDDIKMFAKDVFNDEDYDLSRLTQTIRHLPMLDKSREVLSKLINKGLYIGQPARDYQLNKKHVKPNAPELMPGLCVYTAHQFEPNFIPNNQKIVANVPLTYDFAFWNSSLASAVWEECKYIANAINIDVNIQKWSDIFHLLDTDFKTLTLKQIVHLNLMIQAIAVLYFKHKSLTDDYKKGELTDYIVDNTITNLIKDYHRACVDT